LDWSPRTPRDDVNVSRVHPLSEAATLLGGIGAALALLVVVAFAGVEVAVRWLPYDLEERLFSGLRSAWTPPPAEAGAEAAPVVEARRAALQALLDRLVARWPAGEATPPALVAAIAGESEPNALALPGGLVVVTDGLLRRAGSENELAFVLAHEIGHFRDRDHLRGLGRAAIVGLVLATIGLGDASAAAIAQPFVVVAGRGFDRAQERAADRFALTLVAAEYGHAAGAADFFRRLPDADAGVAARVTGWVSTHPVSEDRIAELDAAAREARIPLDGPLTPLPPGLADE